MHANTHTHMYSLVPRPTLSLLFGCVDNNTRKRESGEKQGRPAWENSSHERHQVDLGRAVPNKHGQAELSTTFRVNTSDEVLKPNQLDDELIED